jgi:hypothetical protein
VSEVKGVSGCGILGRCKIRLPDADRDARTDGFFGHRQPASAIEPHE